MKQKITLLIALVTSIVLLSQVGSASPTNAARPQKFVADTGVITLGPNQLLRLTVTPGPSRDLPQDMLSLNFGKIEYQHGACNNSGVCMHTILAQSTGHNLTLKRGQAASTDIIQSPNGSAVRATVYSDSRNMEVRAFIIDTISGAIVRADINDVYIFQSPPNN